jgi:hypothetical protein
MIDSLQAAKVGGAPGEQTGPGGAAGGLGGDREREGGAGGDEPDGAEDMVGRAVGVLTGIGAAGGHRSSNSSPHQSAQVEHQHSWTLSEEGRHQRTLPLFDPVFQSLNPTNRRNAPALLRDW